MATGYCEIPDAQATASSQRISLTPPTRDNAAAAEMTSPLPQQPAPEDAATTRHDLPALALALVIGALALVVRFVLIVLRLFVLAPFMGLRGAFRFPWAVSPAVLDQMPQAVGLPKDSAPRHHSHSGQDLSGLSGYPQPTV